MRDDFQFAKHYELLSARLCAHAAFLEREASVAFLALWLKDAYRRVFGTRCPASRPCLRLSQRKAWIWHYHLVEEGDCGDGKTRSGGDSMGDLRLAILESKGLVEEPQCQAGPTCSSSRKAYGTGVAIA